MLKKSFRLKTKKDFDFVFANGYKIYAPNFLLLIAEKPSRKDLGPKFGFIASKKVGNAVVRNRAKRLLREAVKCNLKKFNENYWSIFIANKNTPVQKMNTIAYDLEKIIKTPNFYKFFTTENAQKLD